MRMGVFVAVLAAALFIAGGTNSHADTIGPGDCGSCLGAAYTLTYSGSPISTTATTQTFAIDLWVNTAGVATGFLTDVAIKVASASDWISGSLLFGPAGFVEVPGGLAAGGCDGVTSGFDCAHSTTGGVPTPNGTYQFTFAETVATGTLFTGLNQASVKARYVDPTGQLIGLTSENISLQTGPGPNPVPEPASLALLSSGLAGLGWRRLKSRFAS